MQEIEKLNGGDVSGALKGFVRWHGGGVRSYHLKSVVTVLLVSHMYVYFLFPFGMLEAHWR